MLTYVLLAQKHGVVLSLGLAVANWFILGGLVRAYDWTLQSAAVLNLLVYPICIVMSRRYRGMEAPRIKRQWYELPLRTVLVCALMGGYSC